MASKSKKRIIHADSDEEDYVVLDDTGKMIREIPNIMHGIVSGNTSDIKAKIETEACKINKKIDTGRVAEEHVTKKNADQATMLARLNAELRDKQRMIDDLSAQNGELREENGWHKGRAESVQLLIDVPERITSIEKMLRKLQRQVTTIVAMLEHGTGSETGDS